MNEAEARASAPPTRYRAFISYSHADGRLAGWLHRKLETWKLADGSRLAPIFIDRAELAAGPDLSASVREALAGSAALIVIASPAARASRWVAQEIDLFRQLHPDRPVLAALIAGEPDEAFPAALLQHQGTAIEPLAADFRAGRDGKRLALLKIVAGLTRQPLDRLVQRDAQGRQRRVMWITAGALLLSLVLAALLVAALRARSEAQRQRAEAEGMVEFMLTDLRDKLKGVGRLDAMDAVNERAMAHYQKQNDLGQLPDDMLLRRAKVLQAMGADDTDRAGDDPGKISVRRRAEGEIAEAWRETGELNARSPNNPAVLFAHAQSEFYLGMLALSRKDVRGNRDLPNARLHWQAYRLLASYLVELEPSNEGWLRELGFAQGSLCSLELQDASNPLQALAACRAASQIFARIQQAHPDALVPAIELANRLGWESDAALAAEMKAEATALRHRQLELTTRLSTGNPDDARAIKADMLAQYGSAQAFVKLDLRDEARTAAGRALALVSRLAKLDPDNSDWASRMRRIAELQTKLH